MTGMNSYLLLANDDLACIVGKVIFVFYLCSDINIIDIKNNNYYTIKIDLNSSRSQFHFVVEARPQLDISLWRKRQNWNWSVRAIPIRYSTQYFWKESRRCLCSICLGCSKFLGLFFFVAIHLCYASVSSLSSITDKYIKPSTHNYSMIQSTRRTLSRWRI